MSTTSGSYYNRALSSWEPFLEPWRAGLEWKTMSIGDHLGPGGSNGKRSKRTTVSLESSDAINFNLTSTLVELYQMVKANWTEDYYNFGGQQQTTVASKQGGEEYLTGRSSVTYRTPFVPFALRNSTGSNVWFSTQTRLASSQFSASAARNQPSGLPSGRLEPSGVDENDSWKMVKADFKEVVPFTFEVRGKMRHTNSHDVKVHQLIVQVDGWQQVSPVSVDRVGTYFRNALPSHGSGMPPARVVVEVKLEGSARKLVTIRSALVVRNTLPYDIQLKLVNSAFKLDDTCQMKLRPKEKSPVPLHYVWAKMFARSDH